MVVLSAFCGVYPEALSEMVQSVNKETNDSLIFIDTTGWIPEEPLHPGRAAHRLIAEKLAKLLNDIK